LRAVSSLALSCGVLAVGAGGVLFCEGGWHTRGTDEVGVKGLLSANSWIARHGCFQSTRLGKVCQSWVAEFAGSGRGLS
jgi:hypothetical protein